MTEYYDIVLGLIPLSLIGVGGGLYVVGIGLTGALIVGSLIAAGLIGHAMFINGPVQLGDTARTHRQHSQSNTSTTQSQAAD